MAIQIELKITHGSESKLMKELLLTDETWSDDPFLFKQDLRETLERFIEVYGRILESNGYQQSREERPIYKPHPRSNQPR